VILCFQRVSGGIKKHNQTLCLESSIRKFGGRTLLFPFFALCYYEQSHDPLSLDFSTKTTLKKNCYLYSITKHKLLVIKSRIMRWTGHVAGIGSGRGVRRVLVAISEGRRNLEVLIVDGNNIKMVL